MTFNKIMQDTFNSFFIYEENKLIANQDCMAAYQAIYTIALERFQNQFKTVNQDCAFQIKNIANRAEVFLLDQFPFSRIKEKLAVEILVFKETYQYNNTIEFLNAFLPICIYQEEGTKKIKKLIKELNPQQIGSLLYFYYEKCQAVTGINSLYCFIYLLQIVFQHDFGIDTHADFSSLPINLVELSKLSRKEQVRWQINFLKKFLEIKHFSFRPIPKLTHVCLLETLFYYKPLSPYPILGKDFVNFISMDFFDGLAFIDAKQWPNKIIVIGEILKLAALEGWGKLVEELSMVSTDPIMRDIAELFLNVYHLEMSSNERLEALFQLMEWFKHFNRTDYNHLFGKLSSIRGSLIEPTEFFNYESEILPLRSMFCQAMQHGNFIYTLTNPIKGSISVLNAYEKETECLLWSSDLEFDQEKPYSLSMSYYGLLLVRTNDKIIYICDSIEGGGVSEIFLPFILMPESQIEIAQSGIYYIKNDAKLYIGKCINHELVLHAEIDLFNRNKPIRLLGEHILVEPIQEPLLPAILVDATGYSIELSTDFLDIKFYNEVFFVYHQKGEEKFIGARELKDKEFIQIKGKQDFEINGTLNYFDVCMDGTLVILQDNHRVQFINLEEDEPLLKEYMLETTVSSVLFLDKVHQILWTHDKNKRIYRHSLEESKEVFRIIFKGNYLEVKSRQIFRV